MSYGRRPQYSRNLSPHTFHNTHPSCRDISGVFKLIFTLENSVLFTCYENTCKSNAALASAEPPSTVLSALQLHAGELRSQYFRSWSWKSPHVTGTPRLIPPLNPTHRQINPIQAPTASLICILILSSQRFPRRFFPSVPNQNSSRITPPPYVPHTLPISSYLIWWFE